MVSWVSCATSSVAPSVPPSTDVVGVAVGSGEVGGLVTGRGEGFLVGESVTIGEVVGFGVASRSVGVEVGKFVGPPVGKDVTVMVGIPVGDGVGSDGAVN